MEIIWYGHACFRLKNRVATVITDPYAKTLGLSLPKRLKADIITVSHNTPHHNHTAGVKGDFKVIDGPGEYEIKDVFITGIRMVPPDKKNGSRMTDHNNLFVIYMDDIVICHLGDLSTVPTQKQVENMGNIDLLLAPVGGENALDATQAAEVVSLIEPRMVVPMHYRLPQLSIQLEPVSNFLNEMGINNPEIVDSLRITQSSLPEETQVILLNAKV